MSDLPGSAVLVRRSTRHDAPSSAVHTASAADATSSDLPATFAHEAYAPVTSPHVPVRRRAITISETLQHNFEKSYLDASGRRDSVGRQHARVGNVAWMHTEKIEFEPSVTIGSPTRSRASSDARSHASRHRPTYIPAQRGEPDMHTQQDVDLLDVVDPQVATATYLSNVSSAIAVPPLPFFNRKPVVQLDTKLIADTPSAALVPEVDAHAEFLLNREGDKRARLQSAYRGFLAFAATPTGIFFVIYGFLVVFWGAGLVLILIHAIPMSSQNTRDYWVEICSQILNALFTITSVGLFPWRLMDTYRMAHIWTLANRVWRRRSHRGLAKLQNPNDLPLHTEHVCNDADKAESAKLSSCSLEVLDGEAMKSCNEKAIPGDSCQIAPATLEQLELDGRQGFDPVTLLTPQEERRLLYHQIKFQKSQTWYRSHETATHYAFPLKWALLICLFNDANSVFQCLLDAAMWGYATHYHDRPAWMTALGIVLAFSSGIVAGVLIWQGGKRTKKTYEVEQAVKQALKERKNHHLPGADHHSSIQLSHFHLPHLKSHEDAPRGDSHIRATPDATPLTSM